MNLDFERIRSYENLELLARQLVEGFITGLHKSPYHGFSVEFAEHRLFNSGESTRFIDWRVFSRTDKLYVKRFEEETNLRCHILLDNSSSMYYPKENLAKITFAITAAASLTMLLNRQRDAVGLTVFSDQIDYESNSKANKRHQHDLMIKLQQLLGQNESAKKTEISSVLTHIAERAKKRSLIIIMSDFLTELSDREALYSALSHLKYKQHEVIIFDIYDEDLEVNLKFDNVIYDFEDLESGSKVRLNPVEIRKLYSEKVQSLKSDIKEECLKNHIDYVECDVNGDIFKVLNAFLVSRTRMQ